MRVVTKIEVVDVKEDDVFRMMRHEMSPYMMPISSDPNGMPEPVHFETVSIRGHRFCTNREGHTDCVVIGWHPNVEDLLELPLSCFETVQDDIRKANQAGYLEGKNTIWNFLKINKPETDYWWLPIPILLGIAGVLML